MIPLNDLQRHAQPLLPDIEAALARVARSGWYILGSEVAAFEREFAAYCGAADCIGVGNGTDALEIALRALGIGPGDAVATVANAGAYGTVAILATGAVPYYLDINPGTALLDARSLATADLGGVKAIIATHLYGKLCDMPAILEAAGRAGIPVVEDCAQSHGAALGGRAGGSFGAIACYSFYPTKNLGAVGDGGALVGSDSNLMARARQLRQYGWSSKYASTVAGGRNSRLDEAQAAVLRVKLPHLDGWNARRREIAALYTRLLSHPDVVVPQRGGESDIVHLFTVRCARRNALAAHLHERGIATDVHYPTPDYRQPAWTRHAPATALPATERACAETLTLPCFSEMRDDEVRAVSEAVNAWRP